MQTMEALQGVIYLEEGELTIELSGDLYTAKLESLDGHLVLAQNAPTLADLFEKLERDARHWIDVNYTA